MQTVIFGLSALLAAYWTREWWRYRFESVGHAAQFICAAMLWAVVLLFAFQPALSRYHMLWAMPVAFLGSSLVSIPYVRWKMAQLEKKNGAE